MNNIIKDVSILSTIPEKTIEKFFQKFIYCICEQVKEDVLDGKEISELDIGLGTLYIKYIGDEIRFKFVPSNYLETSVSNTVKNKLNLLENNLKDALVKKFVEVYKDLC